MKQYLLAAALLISASASVTTASAADLDPPPPPVDDLRGTSYDWTGAYAGGWVGSACVDGTLTDNSGTPGGTFENSGCGWKGGVVAGYNHQIDSIVIGLEGDWGMSNKIATNEETAVDFSFAFDHIATLRARLGYAFDDTLLYVTAGGAFATGDVDGIISNVPDHINADHWGWTAGIGMEHAITDNFRLRLDYLYTDLGKSDYQEACCDTTVDLKGEHEIRLGGVWAFNGFWMQ